MSVRARGGTARAVVVVANKAVATCRAKRGWTARTTAVAWPISIAVGGRRVSHGRATPAVAHPARACDGGARLSLRQRLCIHARARACVRVYVCMHARMCLHVARGSDAWGVATVSVVARSTGRVERDRVVERPSENAAPRCVAPSWHQSRRAKPVGAPAGGRCDGVRARAMALRAPLPVARCSLRQHDDTGNGTLSASRGDRARVHARTPPTIMASSARAGVTARPGASHRVDR